MSTERPSRPPAAVVASGTAFVLGGGGVLGAAEVGMLRALTEGGIRPDLIVGTSVGALNGALFAADASLAGVRRLQDAWTGLQPHDVFGGSLLGRVSTLVRHGTYLHSNGPLRDLVDAAVPAGRIEDLPVHFECVAASIERAAAHWFDHGPLTEAVLASCAVPGLLPPVEIGGEHFVDGGLVHSVPVGRAVARGATRIFVLHVGRSERPLAPPRFPWEVGLVAFEIARRYRFAEDIASAPAGVEIHVLPSGREVPLVNLRYRGGAGASGRIEAAYRVTSKYLDDLSEQP